MRTCQFNFNNEADTFEIHIEDDGRVAVPGTNGEILAEYDSVAQLAEIYAQARDVKPENLKNWTLLENGNVFSYVLRAGTAGVNVGDMEGQLEEAFTSLGGDYHPLNIARAKAQIMADPASDLVDALARCSEEDIAGNIYDALSDVIEEAPAEEAHVEEEEVDNRTDLEKYVDRMAEVPGALRLIAMMANIPMDSEKAEVLEALTGNMVLSNVNVLQAAYDNTINEAVTNGIGVSSTADALTVITQAPAGTRDDATKERMIGAATLARRGKVNVSVDIVGKTHIRHTAEMITLDELADTDLLMRNNVPYIVRFSDTVDDEIEAEIEAKRDEAAAEVENDGFGNEDEPDGSYEDDYIPEEDDEDDGEEEY